MRAVRVLSQSQPIRLEEIPEPQLRPGSALVRMEAVTVLSYLKRVLNGDLGYDLPPMPFTPGTGGIGRIEAVSSDVVGLEPGQRVFVDPRYSSPENTVEPASICIGLAAFSERAKPLLNIWRDGSFAEKSLRPVECLTPLDRLEQFDSTRLACMSKLMTAYGGLLKGHLQTGDTLLVNGATGSLGSAAVPLALAMGAARVIALGRNERTLTKLVDRMKSNRVAPVVLSGEFERDLSAIEQAGGAYAHIALDLIGWAEDDTASVPVCAASGEVDVLS